MQQKRTDRKVCCVHLPGNPERQMVLCSTLHLSTGTTSMVMGMTVWMQLCGAVHPIDRFDGQNLAVVSLTRAAGR